MTQLAENISSRDSASPTARKRSWKNPRLLLLIPAAVAVGVSTFFIVRRRRLDAMLKSH